MRKRVPCRVIKTISTNNRSSYFNDFNTNIPYNLHQNSALDLGTMFYTTKMKTINLLNNDHTTENSLDCYA